MRIERHSVLALALLPLLLGGCGKTDSGAALPRSGQTSGDKVVNLFIWADDIAPDTLLAFERQTGIRVNVSNFDSPETLESRMLMGSSGFDVVVPTAAFVQRQIRSGAYLALDREKLPNWANLDAALLSRVALNDPGNRHTIVYTWGTFGIGVNRAALEAQLKTAPINSWRLIFEPALAARLAKCGISVMDDAVGVVRIALIFLGRDSNAPNAQDLADVEQLLAKIRPFIRTIDTSGQIQALANGDVCLALAYNGTVVQASKRSKEAGNANGIEYLIPQEGSLLWFDLMAIPRDAPDVANAYRFLNYLMEPRVIAKISNSIGYANANRAATPWLDAAVAADPAVYPTSDQQARLVTQAEPTPELARAITRLWQRFKTGE